MIGRCKAYMHASVLVDITPVILIFIQFLEPVFHHIIIDVRIFLFHDPFEGCKVLICDSIPWFKTFYFSIGHPQGEIGIRIKAFIRLELHQSFHIYPLQAVVFGIIFPDQGPDFLIIFICKGSGQNVCRIFKYVFILFPLELVKKCYHRFFGAHK